MKETNEMYTTYETDDIERAKLVASKEKNTSVVYHNPKVKIPPILTLKVNGHSYTKMNPEYVEYLKKFNPVISDVEILKCIKKEVMNELYEKNNSYQSNLANTGKIKKYRNIRKK